MNEIIAPPHVVDFKHWSLSALDEPILLDDICKLRESHNIFNFSKK